MDERTLPLTDGGSGSPRSARSPSLTVTVVAGPDAGQSRRFPQRRVLLGRGETSDLRLTDPTVSLFHAELEPVDARIAVRDLGSRNGTRAGEVMVERCTVPPGALLTLGSTVVRVELADEFATSRSSASAFGTLVGGSPVMRELYDVLERLARTELSVHVAGETGTGKELAARAIHAAGRRGSGPFVVLDCTAVPTSIAASVLFGHDKGAFTGASDRRVGVFESAHGGTLFIDEVGELPLELQPMLLRVLQHREVVPIGRTRPVPVDVRIVSATWRDLRAMVNAGAFREDLFYRLAQATVRVPSLAERREDVGALVQHFLQSIPPDVTAARGINREALEALTARSYPGNVRELQSTVERLAMLANGPMITAGDLAFERMLSSARGRTSAAAAPATVASRPAAPHDADDEGETPADGPTAPVAPFKSAKRSIVDEFERAYLVKLLERAQNNLSRAAVLAGLQRHNLRDLLKKHGLHAARE